MSSTWGPRRRFHGGPGKPGAWMPSLCTACTAGRRGAPTGVTAEVHPRHGRKGRQPGPRPHGADTCSPDRDKVPAHAQPLGAVGRARHPFLPSIPTQTRQDRPQPPCLNPDQLHVDTEVARKFTGRPAAGASVVTTAGLPWPVTPRDKQGETEERGAERGSGAPAGGAGSRGACHVPSRSPGRLRWSEPHAAAVMDA